MICLGDIKRQLIIAMKKGDVNRSNHKCLVEWNDIDKTKSWLNYDLFTLTLNNPKSIVSFARNNNLLSKIR
jgi:hypothetical protein